MIPVAKFLCLCLFLFFYCTEKTHGIPLTAEEQDTMLFVHNTLREKAGFKPLAWAADNVPINTQLAQWKADMTRHAWPYEYHDAEFADNTATYADPVHRPRIHAIARILELWMAQGTGKLALMLAASSTHMACGIKHEYGNGNAVTDKMAPNTLNDGPFLPSNLYNHYALSCLYWPKPAASPNSQLGGILLPPSLSRLPIDYSAFLEISSYPSFLKYGGYKGPPAINATHFPLQKPSHDLVSEPYDATPFKPVPKGWVPPSEYENSKIPHLLPTIANLAIWTAPAPAKNNAVTATASNDDITAPSVVGVQKQKKISLPPWKTPYKRKINRHAFEKLLSVYWQDGAAPTELTSDWYEIKMGKNVYWDRVQEGEEVTEISDEILDLPDAVPPEPEVQKANSHPPAKPELNLPQGSPIADVKSVLHSTVSQVMKALQRSAQLRNAEHFFKTYVKTYSRNID